MHHTDKYAQHSSIIWPVWLNDRAFVHKLSGSWFESSCSHLNFRYHAGFEQGVPWHLGNYGVQIHSETRSWQDKSLFIIFDTWAMSKFSTKKLILLVIYCLFVLSLTLTNNAYCTNINNSKWFLVNRCYYTSNLHNLYGIVIEMTSLSHHFFFYNIICTRHED